MPRGYRKHPLHADSQIGVALAEIAVIPWRTAPARCIGVALAETAEIPSAVHPMGETAKLRTG